MQMCRAMERYARFAWERGLSRLETLGKTLILGSSQLFTHVGDPDMYSLFSLIARFIPLASSATPANGVAHNLMERAEAGAGRDPQQAQELRSAAYAYLSVVR